MQRISYGGSLGNAGETWLQYMQHLRSYWPGLVPQNDEAIMAYGGRWDDAKP